MTEAEIDALFGRVFATPDGAELRTYLRDRETPLAMFEAEISARVRRMRERWRTGAPEARREHISHDV